MPAPPMPTNQSRRPASSTARQARSAPRRSRRQRAGRATREHRARPSRASRAGSSSSSRTSAGTRASSALRNDDGGRRPPRSAARSSSGGRPSRADKGRGRPACPRPRARRPTHRHGASTRSAAPSAAPNSCVNGTQPVVGPRHAVAQRLEVALAGEVEHRRSLGPSCSTTSSFRLRAPWLPPKTSSTGPSAGSSKRRRPSSRAVTRERAGTGRPVTTELRRRLAHDRKREEDAPRERRRQPVGEAEVRVGLDQRRRDLPRPGGEDHRPGDVAAAAEHDVGLPAREDLPAGARRPAGERERPEQRHGRLAREARRCGTGRTRSPRQERAALRLDPATRRRSRVLRGR